MNLLEHKAGRGFIAFAFYFAEGAPIGFIWWAMPTMLRQSGAGLDVIGTLTAALTLPWVFKFLWAPLVDVLRSPQFGFAKWIALAQLCMCLTLLPLVFIPVSGNFFLWGVLLFLHSICAATQDVSVDALVINVVSKQEKGMLNGYMQAGMLTGRSLFGGGALYFMAQLGVHVTVGMMIAAILCTMLILPLIKEPAAIHHGKDRVLNFRKNLRLGFRTARTWHALIFALTAAAAFEAAGAMAGPFLTDKEVSLKSIGFFFGVPVVIFMLIGGLIGGFLSDKMSRKKAVTVFLCGFVAMVASIALLGFIHPGVTNYSWMILFSGMYFFTGMFTSASYALFMDVTNPALGATQFSTYMAATNGCEAWVVWVAGLLAASHGYGVAFLIMCFVSLFSLFFLHKIRIE